MIRNLFEKLSVKVMEKYIEFVYKTSKVSYNGFKNILTEDGGEKVVALFWHGDSYCLYPALKGSKLYVITTKDRRGDYISDLCNYFGYKTLRVPDQSDGGNYLFKIGDIINDKDVSNIAISMDGPLGPYHEIKDFAIAAAYLVKRRVMPISISVQRKIELTKRWDDFKIPLPFNKIIIHFNYPMEITRDDKKEKFATKKKDIKTIMKKTDLK